MPRAGEEKVGILVAPWMETAVPWYSIALALLYRARGLNAVIVFADTPIPNPAERPGQIAVIASVMKTLEPHLEVIRLSELVPESLTPEDAAEVDRLVELNALAYLKRSGLRDAASREACRLALTASMGQIKRLFATTKFDHCVVPGGIYNDSGLFYSCGRKHRVRIASYDCGPGSMTMGVDDIAAYSLDIAKLFAPGEAAFVDTYKAQAIAMAQQEFDDRRQARDRYGYAAHAYDENRRGEIGDVLIPLSIFDDAAGLGRHRLFDSPEQWAHQTVAFLLENTAATVVVREHPCARLLGRDDRLPGMLEADFGSHPRYRFVSCEDKTSTYNLLESAHVVLPCASSVGVEAAALGKRVIVESSVYYAPLDFVEQAHSKEDYFACIARAASEKTPLADKLREQAWLCYFFSNVVNYVDCTFTPMPVDFSKWSRWSFTKLQNHPKVRLIVDTFSLGIPSARLQSELILSGAASLTPPPGQPRFSLQRLWPWRGRKG